MSIRNIDIQNISRKEKQDLIDQKVYEFEENMNEIENTLNILHEVSFNLTFLIFCIIGIWTHANSRAIWLA